MVSSELVKHTSINSSKFYTDISTSKSDWNILFFFQRIIVYLPDLIHVRWQFNSIGKFI